MDLLYFGVRILMDLHYFAIRILMDLHHFGIRIITDRHYRYFGFRIRSIPVMKSWIKIASKSKAGSGSETKPKLWSMEVQNDAMKAQPGAVEPQNGGVEAHNGPAKGLKARVVDSHHFDEEPDPDLH
jgi:hypothetical protein